MKLVSIIFTQSSYRADREMRVLTKAVSSLIAYSSYQAEIPQRKRLDGLAKGHSSRPVIASLAFDDTSKCFEKLEDSFPLLYGGYILKG